MSVLVDGFAGCPVFLAYSLREIGSIEAPINEIPRLPHHWWTRRLQPLSVAVGGDIAIEHSINLNNAGVCHHIGNQRMTKGIERQVFVNIIPLSSLQIQCHDQ